MLVHLSLLVTRYMWSSHWIAGARQAESSAVTWSPDQASRGQSPLSPLPARKMCVLCLCVYYKIFTNWLNNGLIIEKCHPTQPTPLPPEQLSPNRKRVSENRNWFPIRRDGLTEVVLRITKWHWQSTYTEFLKHAKPALSILYASLLWTECLCPVKFIHWNLIPNVIVLSNGAFRRWVGRMPLKKSLRELPRPFCHVTLQGEHWMVLTTKDLAASKVSQK